MELIFHWLYIFCVPMMASLVALSGMPSRLSPLPSLVQIRPMIPVLPNAPITLFSRICLSKVPYLHSSLWPSHVVPPLEEPSQLVVSHNTSPTRVILRLLLSRCCLLCEDDVVPSAGSKYRDQFYTVNLQGFVILGARHTYYSNAANPNPSAQPDAPGRCAR